MKKPEGMEYMDERTKSEEEMAEPNNVNGVSAEPETQAAAEQPLTAERTAQTGQQVLLADILKAAAGRSGGVVEAAVDEFLGGRGELLELVRTSLTGRKTAAKKKIAAFLEEKFKLSGEVALVIASLLIKVAPGAGDLVEKVSPDEKKPARKKKAAKSAKKTAKTKKTASKTKAKTKKKTAPKKKKATAKSSAKKTRKSKSSAAAKKPAARKK